MSTGVVQVVATVTANEPAGAYRHLTLVVPGIAELARPGQFIAIGIGNAAMSSALLRRTFSLHRVTAGPVPEQDTAEIIVAAAGKGTVWLSKLPRGARISVVGPLGRPFPMPVEPVGCVLVGGGYGSAPLFWLAEGLVERGCRVAVVLGAATQDRLFGAELAQGVADAVVVCTDDGSAGVQGWVSEVLDSVITDADASVVYGCGPMPMLAAVTRAAQAAGIVAQVAVEEAMACGVGVCMTCVMPVTDARGTTRMVRSCVEGPVFRGDRIRWDAYVDGRFDVPDDCVGSPAQDGGVL